MSTRLWGHAERLPAGGERFDGAFKSREEAIEDGRKTYRGGSFWIAGGDAPTPESLMPDVDDIVERITEHAWNEGRGAAEEFPQLSEEARTELEETLTAWAKKHLDVNFWVQQGTAEKIDPA
jgi:hypothetical protein